MLANRLIPAGKFALGRSLSPVITQWDQASRVPLGIFILQQILQFKIMLWLVKKTKKQWNGAK